MTMLSLAIAMVATLRGKLRRVTDPYDREILIAELSYWRSALRAEVNSH